jgi:hypothetical protein
VGRRDSIIHSSPIERRSGQLLSFPSPTADVVPDRFFSSEANIDVSKMGRGQEQLPVSVVYRLVSRYIIHPGWVDDFWGF